MRLARKFDGEIICADSQTIRSDLDIGTAKPSKADQEEIVHHMLDVIEPYGRFSVAEFQKQANVLIENILARNKTPIIAGGTGLYIDSLFYDYDLSIVDSEPRFELEEKSIEELQKIIIDSDYPMPENSKNKRYLIGTIARKGKSPINKTPRKDSVIYGLLPADEILKQRINDRTEIMFEQDLVGEVENILEQYGKPKTKIDAIGYPVVQSYLSGDTSLDETKEVFKRGHWQYARRQKAWFKRNSHIRWFTDTESGYEYISAE